MEEEILAAIRRAIEARDPHGAAAAGGYRGDIVAAMDPDYVREWPMSASDWAVQLKLDYGPKE